MPLERDIIEKIQANFSTADATTAIEMLDGSGYEGRLGRCIVFAAFGRLDLLQHWIEVAAQDWRDVIVAGEYNDDWQRVRDLSLPFPVGPE